MLAQRIHKVAATFGKQVELFDDGGNSLLYYIVEEFKLQGNHYVALQTTAMRKQDEVDFFRVSFDQDEQPELESIDDVQEWEAVEEAFDDLQFIGDDMP